MERIGIDIVILPPENIMKKFIEINKKSDSYLDLGFDDFVPHITLCIGGIFTDNLDKLIDELENNYRTINPIEIKASQLIDIERKDGNNPSWVNYEMTDELKSLHEITTKTLMKYQLKEEATKEMLVDGNKTGLSEMTKSNIEEFYKLRSFENYDPHTTLGCYNAKSEMFPLKFIATRIAIYHVGDKTTCRKKLFEFELKV